MSWRSKEFEVFSVQFSVGRAGALLDDFADELTTHSGNATTPNSEARRDARRASLCFW